MPSAGRKRKPATRPTPKAHRPARPSRSASKPKVAAKAKPTAPPKGKTAAKPASKPGVKAPATPAEPAGTTLPRPGDSRRHVMSLSFLRDGDEFLARMETDSGQITELKNRSLDQLLTLVASELEDLLE